MPPRYYAGTQRLAKSASHRVVHVLRVDFEDSDRVESDQVQAIADESLHNFSIVTTVSRGRLHSRLDPLDLYSTIHTPLLCRKPGMVLPLLYGIIRMCLLSSNASPTRFSFVVSHQVRPKYKMIIQTPERLCLNLATVVRNRNRSLVVTNLFFAQ